MQSCSSLPLLGQTTTELTQLLKSINEQQWRGKQIARHIYQRTETSFLNMQDLPLELRKQLEENFTINPIVVEKHLKSTDSVDKLLVHSGDHQLFECVLLPYSSRVSCCISSQVGCPMGCHFCATGLGGFDRNLSVAEIIGQFHLLQSISPARISHLVFMGMGEPLLNLHHVLKAIEILHNEIGMSYRHITLSTVGIVPQIRKLASCKLPIHLALSLHSPLDEIRTKIMPVNKKWPVQEVIGAMREYQKATGRKVTFEYLLIHELNDTAEQARALAKLIRDIPSVVNLIPFNYVDTKQEFQRPTANRVLAFRKELENLNVNVTQRTERGHKIAAACGQLAGQHSGRFSKRGDLSRVPCLS